MLDANFEIKIPYDVTSITNCHMAIIYKDEYDKLIESIAKK